MAEQKQTTSPNPAGASSSAALQGQITAPNPLEILWEKYKAWIIGLGVLLVAGIAATYLMAYLERQRRNQTWNTFAEGLQFRQVIAPDDAAAGYGMLQNFDRFLAEQSVAEIEQAVSDLQGTQAQAWAVWALATRHAREGDVEATQAALDRLRTLAPKFPGVVEQEAPPVFRPLTEEQKKAKSEPRPGAKPVRPEPAEKMSPASVLLEMARENRAMREQNSQLYTPPEPSSPETIVFDTSEGSFEVRLYSELAPKSSERFLENVRQKLYDGMRFHRIERYKPNMRTNDLVFLGHPESKSDDKTKWNPYQSEDRLEFEDSGVSHFPFMVGFERQSGQKDNDAQLIYFTVGKDAPQRDGNYTIFGRVVQGQEILTRIHEGELNSEAEEQAGSGVPRRPVLVKEVRVKE